MREKVNNWIDNGSVFSEGVALLASTGKYKQLVKSISGRPHRYADKLRYELLKLSAADDGVSTSDYILSLGEPKTKQDIPENQTSSEILVANPSPTTEQISPGEKQLPAEVEQVIKLYSDAYKTRAILHEAMANLPSGNTQQLVAKRKIFSDQISDCSTVIDTMHKAKEDYYINGIIPIVELLIASYTDKTNSDELPDTPDELKKFKREIQAFISKDQHMLDYQQYTKGKNLNPMPQGSKRTKVELRLKSRLDMLEKIEYKLHELS